MSPGVNAAKNKDTNISKQYLQKFDFSLPITLTKDYFLDNKKGQPSCSPTTDSLERKSNHGTRLPLTTHDWIEKKTVSFRENLL